DLAVCEQRDTKGLYAKARAGDILHFTGISSPYEPPETPELRIQTGSQPIEACVQQVIEHLESLGVLEHSATNPSAFA
ncbi:adenylyl-sulfate kinase, partial [Synechococcus sp. BA-124 BA4]